MTMHLAPDRLALPPPIDVDLVDAGRTTGWITDDAVGFRGFGDETETAHAAWVGHRALARRLARTHGIRPVPVDIEPLSIQRVDGKEMILASGRPIATIVRPGPDSRSGVDSLGFELRIPSPITELEARALAYLVYRTLRKSGIRWALWRPDAPGVAEGPAAERSLATVPDTAESGDAATSENERTTRTAKRMAAMARPRASTDPLTVFAALPLAAVAVLTVGVAPFVTIPIAAVLMAAALSLRSRRVR